MKTPRQKMIEEDPKVFDEQLKKSRKVSTREYRSIIIEATIQFEAYLDEIILKYFCKEDTQNDFLILCLQKDYFTLSKKTELVKTIAKRLFDDKHLQSEFGKQYSKELDKIFQHRNKCAHVEFNEDIFKRGDDLFFGSELNKEQTNLISIRVAASRIIMGVRFAGYIMGKIEANKKSESA